MRGKLIVIEGTDCSGKETQSKLLIEYLNNKNISAERFSFPDYDTPTGKIVGGPYLGKEQIGPCWFKEGAVNVDPRVVSLYYAADRKYNIDRINDKLNSGINVVIDRYTYSSMAHQGCKILDKEERLKMYDWIEKLEFDLLELPKPDIAIFLHMPTNKIMELKSTREEKADEHESNIDYLKSSEQSYLEISKIYNFDIMECTKNDKIKSIEDIQNELRELINSYL